MAIGRKKFRGEFFSKNSQLWIRRLPNRENCALGGISARQSMPYDQFSP
jgi:hypothetical protein